MEILLTKGEAKALLLIAGKDDVRYYLNGVCLDAVTANPVLVATNGHGMLALRTKSINDEPLHGKHILPREAIEVIAKAKCKETTLTIDDGKVTFAINGATYTHTLVDGTYPDWRRVLPRYADDAGKATQFNADYLADFQQVKRELTGKKTSVVFVAHNGNNSALVGLGMDSAIGVLMPMRGEASTTLPDWV